MLGTIPAVIICVNKKANTVKNVLIRKVFATDTPTINIAVATSSILQFL